MSDRTTVVYATDGEQPHERRMRLSRRTLEAHSAASVFCYRGDCPHPGMLKTDALQTAAPRLDRVLWLDADTWVTGDVEELPLGGADLAARPGTLWEYERIDGGKWRALFEHFGLEAEAPFYCAGVLLLGGAAMSVCDSWAAWRQVLEMTEGQWPHPIPERWRKGPRHFYDQMALSLLIVDQRLEVLEWDRAEHSYGWHSEPEGVVHHLGSRWTPPPEHLR